jgi:hypothetical protein
LPGVKENAKKMKQYRVPEDWIYKHYSFLFD